MSSIKKYISWIFLFLLILTANWFTSSSTRVEKWYTDLFYMYFSRGARMCIGWLPFSLGDTLYTMIICAVLFFVIRWLKILYKSDSKIDHIKKGVFKSIFFLGWSWLLFNILWGFNYYRESISVQFDLTMEKYPSKLDLENMTRYLLEETNNYAAGRINGGGIYKENVQHIKSAYNQLSIPHTHLSYSPVSFKSSLFGSIGNYMGYSGYYNPFTGEAQINSCMPAFTIPFTSLHEVAHQLGYAKESEANFIGYLAATHSSDSSVRYSANLEMFLYANGALSGLDSTLARKLMHSLSDTAKKDLKEYEAFVHAYQGPIDHATTWFYAKFLKFNNQPEGMRSYSRVTLWLLAYFKKQKKIA